MLKHNHIWGLCLTTLGGQFIADVCSGPTCPQAVLTAGAGRKHSFFGCKIALYNWQTKIHFFKQLSSIPDHSAMTKTGHFCSGYMKIGCSLVCHGRTQALWSTTAPAMQSRNVASIPTWLSGRSRRSLDLHRQSSSETKSMSLRTTEIPMTPPRHGGPHTPRFPMTRTWVLKCIL